MRQEQRIFDLLVESSISGDMSCGMIDQKLESGGNRWKGKTDDLRNEFCWEV